MRTPRRMEVTLTLVGPILTRGSRAAEPGIDAPVARDARGRVMLPYSLVKGKVLDALRELRADAGELGDWFGRRPDDSVWEPDRGRLRFTDFVTDTPGRADDAVIERIRLDHESGATQGRMLAVIEAPFGYGQPVVFRGAVEFAATDDEADDIRRELERAFRWVPSYGGLRTVGFGRTRDVAVAAPVAAARTAAGTPTGDPVVPVRLAPDRPLCLVGKKHARNHFDSLESIPGAVLKGAVARLLLDCCGVPDAFVDSRREDKATGWRTLWRHLEVIRFAEARPILRGTSERRPVEPPLSLVTYRDQRELFGVEFFDVALDDEPKLLKDKTGHSSAPAFAIDWKEKASKAVRSAFGWPHVSRERRVRTAINPVTGRADENRLFSYGLVLPEKGGQALVWETEIGLAAVPSADRAAVRAELADLLAHGLPNIGKTRATADIEWLTEPTPPKVGSVTPPAGVHVVTLQTEFLMTDPERLRDGPENLSAAYEAFWAEASGRAFRLERFFACQSLHGGYLAKRYGRGSGGYEPYLATDRGSTFVLKPTGTGNPAGVLTGWRESGLRVPKWVEVRYGSPGRPLWQTCPFLSHVGFGEVAIDLACHTSRRVP